MAQAKYNLSTGNVNEFVLTNRFLASLLEQQKETCAYKAGEQLNIDSRSIPNRNSVSWHRAKGCKVPKGSMKNILRRSTLNKNNVKLSENKLQGLKSKYPKHPYSSRSQHDLSGLSCKMAIMIKAKPHQESFTMKNVARISMFLGNNQLLLVSKHTVQIFCNINFCIVRKYLSKVNFSTATDLKIIDPVLIYSRKPNALYEISSSSGLITAVNRITFDTNKTVYYDILHNKFADSKRDEFLKIVNGERSPFNVLSPRPVSLDPIGFRQLDNNVKVQSYCIIAPFHQIVIAQPSDADEERRASQLDSRFGYPRDISTDQYTFYQPRLRGTQQHPNKAGSSNHRAAYGQFTSPENRRRSFIVSWPHCEQTEKTELMIKHGFFFTGKDDLIRCYECGIGLKDWSESDDPLCEHVRYSPDCKFLIDTIPPTELERIKASLMPNNVVSSHESRIPEQAGLMAGAEDGATTDEVVLSVEPRNPQYRKGSVRISSFSKWPRDLTQTPEELADAGFFYTGYNDIVRCYVCDGGLQKWSPEDNAWVEHARWFPHCAYVRQRKGQDFIELVRLSAEQQAFEETQASGSTHGYTSTRTEDAITYISNLEISTTNESGQGNQDARREILDTLKEIVPEMSEEKLLKAIADMERKGEGITTETVALYVTDDNNGYNIDKAEANTVSFSEKEPETLTELIDETEKLRSVIKCAKCKQNDANCLFLPCAHHMLCMPCSANISTCIRCDKRIKKRIKTFMS